MGNSEEEEVEIIYCSTHLKRCIISKHHYCKRHGYFTKNQDKSPIIVTLFEILIKLPIG